MELGKETATSDSRLSGLKRGFTRLAVAVFAAAALIGGGVAIVADDSGANKEVVAAAPVGKKGCVAKKWYTWEQNAMYLPICRDIAAGRR